MKKRSMIWLATSFVAALVLGGCAPSTSNNDAPAVSGDETIEVGFFGFAASNSYAQGVYLGVEEAAKELGATAEFVDGQFDGQLQARQITDAITSKQYDVIVIQANNNLVVQEPLTRAVEAGITVVIEFVPVGPDFETIEPQVEGAISIVDSPVGNGTALANMGLLACEDIGGTCKVAYMQGDPSLPLDNARTKAAEAAISAGGSDVELLPTVTGGYTANEGRTAFQDILQGNPDVNVVIGSSQAIAGADLVAGPDSDIKFVANGSPQSAVEKVRNGDWFSLWALDVVKNGYTAAEYGIKHARGEDVPMATDERSLAPNDGIGTKEALDEADFVSGYDE